MSAKEVGFSEQSEDGKEGFGGANLILEKLKGVGEGLADGPTQSAKAEGVQECFRLVANAGGAVLEIFVVEAQAWVDPDGVHPGVDRTIDLATKVVEQGSGMVGRVDEVTDGADMVPLNVAEDDAGSVVGDYMKEVIRVAGPSKIEDGGSGFEAAAGDFGLISFNRNEGAFLGKGLENGEKSGDLLGGVDPRGMVKRGFGAEIDQVSALGSEAPGTNEGGVGIENHAFAVPGVWAEIDDPHEMGTGGRVKGLSADFEFGDLRGESLGVFLGELSQGFERKHWGKSYWKFRAGARVGWTEGGEGIQSTEMKKGLMTQAELMAWEVKARRWLVLGLTLVVTGVLAVGGMTLQISYAMLKKSEVMQGAVERVVADERVKRELGEPMELGWAVTGELEDQAAGGLARLDFSLRGSRRAAGVTLRAEKNGSGIWKYLLLEVKVPGVGTISCADQGIESKKD